MLFVETIAHIHAAVSSDGQGQVGWIELCPTDELPCLEVEEIERRAWAILGDADTDMLAILATVRQQAADYGFPEPKTVQDYLAWIEDEFAWQMHTAVTKADKAYAQLLSDPSTEIRDLDFEPSPLPWATKDCGAPMG